MSEGGFLEKMKPLVHERVAAAKKERAPEFLIESLIKNPRPVLNFKEQVSSNTEPRIIAEIKRRSPSRGEIASDLKPVDIARAYVQGGASAISVLTEPHYFGGSVLDLQLVRQAFPTMPLLMKDFVLDSYQLLEARYFGADAVLLIYSLLGQEQTEVLFKQAVTLGLTPLVEVHSASELESVLQLGASLIGVNNRNLKTLKTDLNVSENLVHLARGFNATLISESGIENTNQIRHLYKLGYKAFLVGTSLMINKTPEDDLRQLISGNL